jgi:hypothetical protein
MIIARKLCTVNRYLYKDLVQQFPAPPKRASIPAALVKDLVFQFRPHLEKGFAFQFRNASKTVSVSAVVFLWAARFWTAAFWATVRSACACPAQCLCIVRDARGDRFRTQDFCRI